MITKYLENLPLQSVSFKRDLQALEHKILRGFFKVFCDYTFRSVCLSSLSTKFCISQAKTKFIYNYVQHRQPLMYVCVPGRLQGYSKTLRPKYINFA